MFFFVEYHCKMWSIQGESFLSQGSWDWNIYLNDEYVFQNAHKGEDQNYDDDGIWKSDMEVEHVNMSFLEETKHIFKTIYMLVVDKFFPGIDDGLGKCKMSFCTLM